MNNLIAQKSIVLFDGSCNFCNASLNFVVRHNKNNCFVFIALQSDMSKELLKKFNLPENFSGSMVLIENDSIYFKSTAALRMIRKLNPVMNWLYVFILVPEFLRDAVYNLIANNRYRWFGEQKSCVIRGK